MGDKSYPLTLNKEDLLRRTDLPARYQELISRLHENNDISVLKEFNEFSFIDQGVFGDTGRYKFLQDQHSYIRKILGEIKSSSSDSSTSFYADVLLAESYRNLEGIEQASKEYDRIISSYSDELKSEAYRLKSLALFSSDSRGYALDIYRGLYEAIRLGNKDASLTLLQTSSSLVNERRNKVLRESGEVFKDLPGFLQQNPSESWGSKISEGVFSAASITYYGVSGRTDELLARHQWLLDVNNQRLLAYDGVRSLVSNGIFRDNWQELSMPEKLALVSQYTGLDKTVSPEELTSYLTQAGVDFSSSGEQFHSSMERFFRIIHEKEGPVIANGYFDEFERLSAITGSIDKFTRMKGDGNFEDPALYLAFSGGELSGLSNSQIENLRNAFTTDRVGERIEKNFLEKGVLQTADFVAGGLLIGGATVGAGKLAAKAGLGKYFQTARSVVGPLETVGSRSGTTAGLIGAAGDAAAQEFLAQAISVVSPTGAEWFRLASVLGGRDASISVIKDTKGNVKLFVQAEFESQVQQLKRSLRGRGIEVGTNLPKGYEEVASGTVEDIISGIGLRAREGQKVLSEMNVLKPDLSDLDIARIQRGEFTTNELARINKAKQLLSENGFKKEAQLLNDREMQKELLFSHYSGNKVDGINVFTKAKPLLKQGFSKDAVRVLGDKEILGVPIKFKKFIQKNRKIKESNVITNAFNEVEGILQQLSTNKDWRGGNIHNVEGYKIVDANALNKGGGSGRGNWRYVFKEEKGNYIFRGIAEHGIGPGGFDWYFID